MTSTQSPTGKRRRGGRRGERPMVPDAKFTSYYGRPVVKPSPWQADIPAYLFLGGLAGGSAVLAAGADITGRPALRRSTRFGALAAISLSMAALIHDLGRPMRFLNMLRVIKPTSPMSMGTWLLAGFGPMVGVAAAGELPLPGALGRASGALSRPAGLAAAALAPAVVSYTAVLIADTATPSWHDAYRELPFVFVGSAAAAAGGWGLLMAPVSQSGPARRLAVGGAVLEFAAEQRMEKTMGLTAEPLHDGTAGKLMRASKACTSVGVVASLLGRRGRAVSAAAGVALLAGSALQRFGIFHAGQQSALDPKYTVVPQRERLNRRAGMPSA